MDVRDLEVFLAVAARLNFTRAGEDVHLSQPSVSVRVRGLEEELGVKLFEQSGKRVTLTDAGRLLEPYARRVVAAVDDARSAIEEFQGLERGSLAIGASTTPGMYLVPKVIAEFKRQYPKIDIRLAVHGTRQVEEGVIRNEYDFGFVGGHLVGDDVEVIPWQTDGLVLIVPPDHRLTRKRIVVLRDLVEEQFVFRERGSATQALVESSLRKVNFRIETAIEIGNPEAVKQAVRGGVGIAMISRFAVEAELQAKTLVALKIKSFKADRELKIVHRKDKHLNPAATAFIATAKRLQTNWR